MAKSARTGELRTRIMVFECTDECRDKDGFPVEARSNVFGNGATRMCKWVNAYGAEVYTARQAGVEEPATITMRYSRAVTPTCLVYKMVDDIPYEVISINDVEERHTWLELKVKRKVAAK